METLSSRREMGELHTRNRWSTPRPRQRWKERVRLRAPGRPRTSCGLLRAPGRPRMGRRIGRHAAFRLPRPRRRSQEAMLKRTAAKGKISRRASAPPRLGRARPCEAEPANEQLQAVPQNRPRGPCCCAFSQRRLAAGAHRGARHRRPTRRAIPRRTTSVACAQRAGGSGVPIAPGGVRAFSIRRSSEDVLRLRSLARSSRGRICREVVVRRRHLHRRGSKATRRRLGVGGPWAGGGQQARCLCSSVSYVGVGARARC